jgi:hypothetical protein
MGITSVASSTTSAVALASNLERRGAIVENTDANRAYVRLGSGDASNTSFSFSLAQNENAAIPVGYTGQISVVWEADGTGSLLITEF